MKHRCDVAICILFISTFLIHLFPWRWTVLLLVSVPSQPAIDLKHRKWLHLRIRSPQRPQQDAGSLASRSPMGSRAKAKRVADGRWTLAFGDEATCLMAHAEVVRAMREQSEAVRRCVSPLLSDIVPGRQKEPHLGT